MKVGKVDPPAMCSHPDLLEPAMKCWNSGIKIITEGWNPEHWGSWTSRLCCIYLL